MYIFPYFSIKIDTNLFDPFCLSITWVPSKIKWKIPTFTMPLTVHQGVIFYEPPKFHRKLLLLRGNIFCYCACVYFICVYFFYLICVYFSVQELHISVILFVYAIISLFSSTGPLFSSRRRKPIIEPLIILNHQCQNFMKK